jgi:hypothetical protein
MHSGKLSRITRPCRVLSGAFLGEDSMNASRLLAAALLATSGSRPIMAQRLAPLAAVTPVASRDTDLGSAIAAERTDLPFAMRTARDTMPMADVPSVFGTVIGGIGGGVVGAFAGAAIGAESARGCHGELCGFGNVVLGFALGESIGVGIGAHLGSRSKKHDHVVLTTLSSVAILTGGAIMASSMGPLGALMLASTPMLQIAAAWGIESAGR